jgi:hypothetical protein
MTEMPALTGSPKQIEWAEKIRAETIDGIRAELSAEFPPEVADVVIDLCAQWNSAAWWIDFQKNNRTYRSSRGPVIWVTYAAGMTNDWGDVTEMGKGWATKHGLPF